MTKFLNKIVSTQIIKNIAKNKRIVLCHGVFDLLHIGHLRYFQEAKSLGDILVVSVTSDRFINKGPGRPRFDLNTRMEALSNIQSIDYVLKSDYPTAENLIKILKPTYYVKGKDYKNNKKDLSKNIYKELNTARSVKSKIYYTKSKIFSSSQLINNSELNLLDLNQQKKIKKLKNVLKSKIFDSSFSRLKKLKVLIIGETILDRYTFGETIGKAGKEPMLVLKEKQTKDYVGGAASIALQVSKFVKKTTLISCLGEKAEYKNFFFSKLKKVNKKFIYKKNSPTILKKRYVDEISNSKTLGVYSLNDETIQLSQEKKLKLIIKNNIKKNDVVIVSDYGHGLISDNLAKFIINNSKKIFINCQINANNKGYHSILKYNKGFCVFINESELRYEIRDQYSKIKSVIKKFCKINKNIKYLLVTQGNQGAIFYDSKKKYFYNYPAFGNKISDKVGAGDRMLSIFSIFFTSIENLDLSLFISSLGAAQTLQNFGNEKFFEKNEILSILKYV